MSKRVKLLVAVVGAVIVLAMLFNHVGRIEAQTNPLSIIGSSWIRLAARGLIPGARVVHKFGEGTIDTTITPVTLSGFYRTPTTATALELVSSSANDTANGSGVQEIEYIGLDSTWTEITGQVETNGITAVPIPDSLVRLHRWYAIRSGTYATQAASSHNSTLTIRESGGGNIWSIIDSVDGLGKGQSHIGAYTIPNGETGWLLSSSITNDSTKVVNFYLFRRCGANDVTTPYTGIMRTLRSYTGITAPFRFVGATEDGPLTGPCDIGYMAKTSVSTATVTVDLELLIIDN